MWNSIKINNDTYMISIIHKNDTIKVFLTNLIEIWIETLTKEIILDRCRVINKVLYKKKNVKTKTCLYTFIINQI